MVERSSGAGNLRDPDVAKAIAQLAPARCQKRSLAFGSRRSQFRARSASPSATGDLPVAAQEPE
jgi:hypothetical protein